MPSASGDLRTSLSTEELISRLRAEMVQQGLLFPQIHAEYQRYQQLGADPGRLRQLQSDRLAALLAHVVRQVPAYRRLGLSRADLADPFRALGLLPLVDKAAISAQLVDYCADDIKAAECRFTVTSGTTGMPFKIIYDTAHLVHSYALSLVRVNQYGWAFDRKILRPYEIWLDGWFDYSSPATGFARIGEFGDTSGPAAAANLVRAKEFRPDVIWGHPTRLLRLAREFDEWPTATPILTYGECLTDAARKTLAGYFRAPVYDLYGIREVNTIAAQCERGGYHIEAERLWLEIVDDEGNAVADGAVGEIVVTNLINRAMPVIRYRTGDVGALDPQPCACGRGQKLLRLIEGRDPGFVLLPDGSRVEALRVVRLMRAFPIERFQVVQSDAATVTVLLRPAPKFTAADADALSGQIRAVLRNQIAVQVRTAREADFHTTGSRKAVDFVNPFAATRTEMGR